MIDPGKFFRAAISDLEAYTPIVPLDVLAERLSLPVEHLVKLDANENPYGPSPLALAALSGSGTAAPHYAIYPDPEQRRLRHALSSYTGQPPERIVCGAGADELIDLLMRLCIDPGDAVIDCPPTFGMYAFDTAVCGGRLIAVPRNGDFALDLAGIEAAAQASQSRLLFLTSPNNPTGNLTPLADIERLLQLPLIVVVDEAYIEFAEADGETHSVASLVGRYPNLVVLRTFSKWAGLAGLRLGYGLMPEVIAEQIWKIKQPYNINLAAQLAGLASLDDLDYLRGNVAQIVAGRERLFQALQTIAGLEPFPSRTNFVLCRVTRGDALELKKALERHGILVRHYRKPLLQNYIRISVGTAEQQERLLRALREELA